MHLSWKHSLVQRQICFQNILNPYKTLMIVLGCIFFIGSSPNAQQAHMTTFERAEPKEYTSNTMDYIGILRLSNAFSVSMDIRPNITSTGMRVLEIWDYDASTPAGPFMPLTISMSHSGYYSVAVSNGTPNGGAGVSGARGSWQPGQSIKIEFTYDNGLCRFYENGVGIGYFWAPQNLGTCKGELRLGSSKVSGLPFFDGQISNVIIQPIQGQNAQYHPQHPTQMQPLERLDVKEYTGNTMDFIGSQHLSDAFAVSMDIRPNITSTGMRVLEIWDYDASTPAGPFMPLTISMSHSGYYSVAVSNGTPNGGAGVSGARGSWQPGQTMNILFTYENGLCRFYENGVGIGFFWAPPNLGTCKGELRLGSSKVGGLPFFDGLIGNVRIQPGVLQPPTGPPQPIVLAAPQQTVQQTFERLQPKAYNGNTVDQIGNFQLPQTFSFSADVRIDQSQQWVHLFEVGGVEFGMGAPFRLETGNEGEWYIALDNGQGIVDFQQQGNWKFGKTINVLFTYDNGFCTLYENGIQVGQFQGPPNVGSRTGKLILGSHKGTERFLFGQMSNVVLTPTILQPPPPPPPPLFENNGTLTFNGQAGQEIGTVTLPQTFTVSAELFITHSDQWRHAIEVGGKEYTWHAPLRLETGNQGEWYFAVGDGQSYGDTQIAGQWQYNQWVQVTLTYANGIAKLYENGQFLGEVAIHKDPSAAPGTLILGSFQGTQRFFNGEMRNVVIFPGEHAP